VRIRLASPVKVGVAFGFGFEEFELSRIASTTAVAHSVLRAAIGGSALVDVGREAALHKRGSRIARHHSAQVSKQSRVTTSVYDENAPGFLSNAFCGVRNRGIPCQIVAWPKLNDMLALRHEPGP
jgi:hypothetical protein